VLLGSGADRASLCGLRVRADANEVITIGRTTRPEVLERLRSAGRIVRQREGDVFVHRYEQRNQSQLPSRSR
jgi:hypothetical protein